MYVCMYYSTESMYAMSTSSGCHNAVQLIISHTGASGVTTTILSAGGLVIMMNSEYVLELISVFHTGPVSKLTTVCLNVEIKITMIAKQNPKNYFVIHVSLHHNPCDLRIEPVTS